MIAVILLPPGRLFGDQSRVDAHRVAEGIHYRRPGDGVVVDLFQRCVVGIAGQAHRATDRAEPEALAVGGVPHAPHRGDVDVTFHLDLDLGQGHATVRGV